MYNIKKEKGQKDKQWSTKWRHMRQRMASMINDHERSKWDSKQPINIMNSDDSNIFDHVGDLDIQPYQFEPLWNDGSQQEREHSTSEDSDIDESSQAQDRLVNTNWWGFVYLLTILKKPTIERKTEITGCTDDEILIPQMKQQTNNPQSTTAQA